MTSRHSSFRHVFCLLTAVHICTNIYIERARVPLGEGKAALANPGGTKELVTGCERPTIGPSFHATTALNDKRSLSSVVIA